MTRWEEVKQLYGAVLAKDATERGAFLDEVCAGDEDLRREVHIVAEHEDDGARFITEPALQVAAKISTDHSERQRRPDANSVTIEFRRCSAPVEWEVYLAENIWLDRQVGPKILPVRTQ